MAKICAAFTQTSNPLWEPDPWELNLLGGSKECIAAKRGVKYKKQAMQNFILWQSTRNSDDILVYKDGSHRLDKARKIAGTETTWTIECRRQWFLTNECCLVANVKVYDAKIIGLCSGLEASLSTSIAGLTSEIHVCTDKFNIAKEAGSLPNSSSQAGFIRLGERVKSWLQKRKKLSVQ